jgi:hypothetical protein
MPTFVKVKVSCDSGWGGEAEGDGGADGNIFRRNGSPALEEEDTAESEGADDDQSAGQQLKENLMIRMKQNTKGKQSK